MFDFNAELEKLISTKHDMDNDPLDHDKVCLISKDDLWNTAVEACSSVKSSCEIKGLTPETLYRIYVISNILAL